jgi:hypothetical protein
MQLLKLKLLWKEISSSFCHILALIYLTVSVRNLLYYKVNALSVLGVTLCLFVFSVRNDTRSSRYDLAYSIAMPYCNFEFSRSFRGFSVLCLYMLRNVLAVCLLIVTDSFVYKPTLDAFLEIDFGFLLPTPILEYVVALNYSDLVSHDIVMQLYIYLLMWILLCCVCFTVHFVYMRNTVYNHYKRRFQWKF